MTPTSRCTSPAGNTRIVSLPVGSWLGYALARVDGCTSTEVLQEILYRYSALDRRDLACDVYDLFVQICPVVFDVTLADTDRARGFLIEYPNISARATVHAAVMVNQGIESIATFDRGFDAVAGIRRVELQ